LLIIDGELLQDEPDQSRVNKRPYALDQTVKGAERWQLAPLANEFFDRDID
jgi:hypothetical protein